MNELLKKEKDRAIFLKNGFYDIPVNIEIDNFILTLTIEDFKDEIGIHINSNIVFSISESLLFIKTINIDNNKEKILFSGVHQISQKVILMINRKDDKLRFSYQGLNSNNEVIDKNIDYEIIYKEKNIPCGVYGRIGCSFSGIELKALQPKHWEFSGDVKKIGNQLSISNGAQVSYVYNTPNIFEEFISDAQNGHIKISTTEYNGVRCIKFYDGSIGNFKIAGCFKEKAKYLITMTIYSPASFDTNLQVYYTDKEFNKYSDTIGVPVASLNKPFSFEIGDGIHTIDYICSSHSNGKYRYLDLTNLEIKEYGVELLQNINFGFKYIGNGTVEILNEDKKIIDAFECKNAGTFFINSKYPKVNKYIIKISSDTNLMIENPQIIDNDCYVDLGGQYTDSSHIQYTIEDLCEDSIGVSFDANKVSEWNLNLETNQYVPIKLIDFISNDTELNNYLSLTYQKFKDDSEHVAKYYNGKTGALYSEDEESEPTTIGELEYNPGDSNIYEQSDEEGSINFIHLGNLNAYGTYGSDSYGELNVILKDSLGNLIKHTVCINSDMHFLEKDFYSRFFINYNGSLITLSIRVSYLINMEPFNNSLYLIKNYNNGIPNYGIVNINGEKYDYKIFEKNKNYYIELPENINSNYAIVESTNTDFNYTFNVNGLFPRHINIDILNNESGFNVDNIMISNSGNNLKTFMDFVNNNVLGDYLYYTTFDELGDKTFVNLTIDNLNPYFPICCYGHINNQRVDYKQIFQLKDRNSLYEVKKIIIDEKKIIRLDDNEFVTNVLLNNLTPLGFYQNENEVFIRDGIDKGTELLYIVYRPYTFCVNQQNDKYMITIANPTTDLKINYTDTIKNEYFVDHLNLSPYYERNNNGFIYINDQNTLNQIECEYSKKDLVLDGLDRICIVVTALGANRSISNNYDFEFYFDDSKLPYNKYVQAEFEKIDTTQSGSYVVYINAKQVSFDDSVESIDSTLIIRDKITGLIKSFKFICKGGK